MSRPVPQPLTPGPGQESVWAYPRPPRLERTARRIEIVLGGVTVADTTAAFRVLETSHPPTYYLPKDAFLPGVLSPAPGRSVCEWKGPATYWTLSAGGRVAEAAGWSYERPTPAFRDLAGHVAVYAGRMDECRVDGEVVTPQPGGFYGGWITSDVVGPFKGEPGTLGW
ncbi:uncharacterized protein (DUF427 family) [Deinococcus metalli]|uniref:Uncharacterized protein (DUF427 family) n=1 Tax=Deinococcus metalli TaxID=1141878 RepID=A0A7W8NS69_9DEIO|nr:DUF427 domain-containing protein [Deinococcus metalli]MBB5377673.1 uncharacterized protein (DUF427 family) [Deinococcus metalli]